MKRSPSSLDLKSFVPALLLILAGLALLLLLGFPGSSQLEHDEKSDYSHIRIRRNENVRSLLFVRDNGTEIVESRVNLDVPHELMLAYSRAMFASYLFKPRQERVLIIGLGGGGMVHFLKHHERDLRVDVVEIDPAIVTLAEEYFLARSEGNIQIITADAFDYLESTQHKYDVIYMDAFLKPSADTDKTGVPERLKTMAFYKSIQSKLSEQGLVVFNLNMHRGTEEDIETIDSAFRETHVFRCPPSRNLVAIGSMSRTPTELASLQSRARTLDERFGANFSFQTILKNRRR